RARCAPAYRDVLQGWKGAPRAGYGGQPVHRLPVARTTGGNRPKPYNLLPPGAGKASRRMPRSLRSDWVCRESPESQCATAWCGEMTMGKIFRVLGDLNI